MERNAFINKRRHEKLKLPIIGTSRQNLTCVPTIVLMSPYFSNLVNRICIINLEGKEKKKLLMFTVWGITAKFLILCTNDTFIYTVHVSIFPHMFYQHWKQIFDISTTIPDVLQLGANLSALHFRVAKILCQELNSMALFWLMQRPGRATVTTDLLPNKTWRKTSSKPLHAENCCIFSFILLLENMCKLTKWILNTQFYLLNLS